MPALRPRKVAVSGKSGPHEALGLRELPDRAQKKPERCICHLLVQHAGRVGDHDPALCRFGDIHVVVPHAKAGDNLEVRQGVHELRGGATMRGASGNAADPGAYFAQEADAIRRFPEAMQPRAGSERLHHDRPHRPGHQNVGINHGHPPRARF
jgi:hypothetical protein